MPPRYPPIDRLPPLQVRIAEDGDGRIAERLEVERAEIRRSGVGRRAVDPGAAPVTPPLAGRLAGLDAFRGLAFLLFAWGVLMPVPLGALLGGGESPPRSVWAGPAAELLAGAKTADLAGLPLAPLSVALPLMLLAAALFAMGAGIPLAAARRSRPAGAVSTRFGGAWAGLAGMLPLRFATLVLVAVLVPVLRPETLGTGPSAALSLLGLLGLVPLTLRFGPEVGRAARWTLHAGGLGICLLVLCLRIDVSATRAGAWAPDPIVLILAWNGLLAAVLWLLTPGGGWLRGMLRLALAALVLTGVTLLPGGVQEPFAPGTAGLPLDAWFQPVWLVGIVLAVAGTLAGDLGVRHLRDLEPPPAGALPREEGDEVRWGTGGVGMMSFLLLGAVAAGVFFTPPLLELLAGAASGWVLPGFGVAAALALPPALAARLLMAGDADASGRWVRSLTSLTLALLAAAVTAGVGSVASAAWASAGAAEEVSARAAAAAALFTGVLGAAAGLSCLLASFTALLDRPAPPVPLAVLTPLTGVGRNPLLLYALLAGPAVVIFGYPLLPIGGGEAGLSSLDAAVSLAIEELWGPDASPVHGVGYGLAKALLIGVPVALLARAGVVLRA